jgi:hypothetical protein
LYERNQHQGSGDKGSFSRQISGMKTDEKRDARLLPPVTLGFTAVNALDHGFIAKVCDNALPHSASPYQTTSADPKPNPAASQEQSRLSPPYPANPP